MYIYIYIQNHLILLDFDFEKLSHTNCTHDDNVLQNLEIAQKECKDDKQCTGVFQEKCTDENNYYLCLKNSTLLTDNRIQGCFHKKFPVGEYIDW